MIRFISALFFIVIPYAYAQPSTMTHAETTITSSALVGQWAMLPLKNGIANVVEFRADGKSLLHAFNCETPDAKNEIETYHYSVDTQKKNLYLTSPNYNTTLNIIALKGRSLVMAQDILDNKFTFSYVKVEKVAPLCFLYTRKDKSKETAFQKSDFIASPQIPDHTDLDKYIGKWELKKVTQLEIIKDREGKAYLNLSADGNWHHLFNDVHWVDNALHFQSYAYSEKPELFSHPFHKSLIPTVITLLPNGKMHVTILISGESSDFELTRE